MNYFIYFLVFIFGLLIGSFINCLIYRLYVKKTFIRGRSFCPKCKHQLVWYDNLPLISYVWLKAKCRYCQRLISIQYPVVEFITGVLFVLVFIATVGTQSFTLLYAGLWSSHLSLLLVRNFIFTTLLIIIFIYDLKYYLILDKVILPAMFLVLLFNISLQLPLTMAGMWYSFGNLFLAALLAGGFFLLQFVVSKGRWIGGGDIRLGILMGLMLGWPNVLAALIIGYLLGSIIGIGLIIFGKKKLKSQVPLGTFLTVSSYLSLLWGPQIIHWYLNIAF